MDLITIQQFQDIDIRVGTIVAAEAFAEAKKPAYKLIIDFGEELGTKKSSAQITDHYTCDQLIGRQILAVVNFPPRQIGPIQSEVLVLGVNDSEAGIRLVQPDAQVANGQRLH